MLAGQKRFRWKVIGMFLLGPVALGLPALGCSVPVFRYALERWEPSPYEVAVVHRGSLNAIQQSLLTELRAHSGSNAMPANFTVRVVDLDSKQAVEQATYWGRMADGDSPKLSLRSPNGARAEIWSGPLTQENVQKVVDSPLRRRICQLLIRGETAVWVFLESGERAKDEAAATVLKSRLEHLEKTLELPKLDPADLAPDSASSEPLRIGFPVLRLARNDATEEVLIRMLLNSEDDLHELPGPLAFPIFGRGRILYALCGEGINHETIDEAGAFLVGPCSCIVKEENPGFDLLLSAAWDRFVRITATPHDVLPELTGLSLAPAAESVQPQAQSPSSTVTSPAPVAEGSCATAPAWFARSCVYIPLAFGGAFIAVLALGTLLLRSKR